VAEDFAIERVMEALIARWTAPAEAPAIEQRRRAA
jgi:hypothetical protein